MAGKNEYQIAGVDYEVLDRMKREAIMLARQTAPLLKEFGGAEIAASRGASAFVFHVGEETLALVVEGLGTKSLIAAEFLALTGVSRFSDIAKDAVAAIVNDVISVGALPVVVTAYFATGDASWYANQDQSHDLLIGWKAACEEAGAVWGGGESPTLPDVVSAGTIELAGSALGIVPRGNRPILGDNISPGDRIVLLPSTGLHANGASLARAAIRSLDSGIATLLRSGRTLGDALLEPTPIYVNFVRSLIDHGIVPKFLNGITGHGFLKIMRSPASVRYIISEVPQVPEVLQYLVDVLEMEPAEAYSTFNMGAGYVAVVSASDLDETLRLARTAGFHDLACGEVEEGSRSLVIPQLGIEYSANALELV